MKRITSGFYPKQKRSLPDFRDLRKARVEQVFLADRRRAMTGDVTTINGIHNGEGIHSTERSILSQVMVVLLLQWLWS
jgi:hypothetical protein